MLFKIFVFLEIILLFIHTTLFSFWDFIIDDFEIEKSTPPAINGSCGSSEAQGSITAPSSNLCSTGNATIVTSWTGSFTWSCNGVNGGTPASCSAPRQYTLTFDANGGTLPTPLTKVVAYNNEIGTLSTTTRDGYVFKWWFDSAIGGTQVTQNTKILLDTTVYAQWDLSINGVCGTASSEATLIAPTTQLCASGTPSSVTSWTGSFTWTCTGQSGGLNAACSTLRQYLVTYDSNGGVTPNPETKKVIYNTEIGTWATTSRSGYAFQWWFDQKIWGTQIISTTKILADTTLYAQWKLIINGSCGSSESQGSITAPSSNLCSTGNATIVTSGTGSFTWSCNGVNGGTPASCSAPRQYTLTFDANGGTLPTPLTKVVTYNNEIGILSTTTRDEYVFKWWFDREIGGTQITQNTKILSDTTVYAQWDLSINGVCGTASSEATLTPPTTQLCASGTPSSVTSGTGSFTWSCAGQSGTTASCSTLRQYLVTYDSNGGVTPNPETQKVIYNTEIGTWATTTRNGYNFQWWFDQKTWGTQIISTTKILANMTLYAQWDQIISSWGGGGWWSAITPKDNCPTWDFSPTYYDGTCGDVKKETSSVPKNEPISTPDTPSITDKKAPVEKPVAPIVENKKLKQCEENELVKARQCVFPKMNIFFSDIDDSFAKNYIQSLGNASIMQGYYDTSLFKPNNTISRAEYLKVLLRSFCIDYSKAVTYNISYTDVDKNAWEAKVIAKALELWVIDKSNSTFRPHQPVTRAEALKMIFQISWVVPKDAYITRFEDVDQSGWEVKYIQKANNMCVVDGYTIDGKVIFQPYKNMTRAEVAKVISNALQMN